MSDTPSKTPRQPAAQDQPLTRGDRQVAETLRAGLSGPDQEWLDDVLTRHSQSERDADDRGEPLTGPMW